MFNALVAFPIHPISILGCAMSPCVQAPLPDQGTSWSVLFIVAVGTWFLIGWVTLCASLLAAVDQGGPELFDSAIRDRRFVVPVILLGPIAAYFWVLSVLGYQDNPNPAQWPPADNNSLSGAWARRSDV